MTTPRTVPGPKEPTEKQFTEQVIDFAQRMGWRVLHIRPAMNRNGHWSTPIQGDGVGWPDLFMVRGREKICAELKVGGGRLEPKQKEWLQALTAAGIPAYVWRPAELDGEILEVLR